MKDRWDSLSQEIIKIEQDYGESSLSVEDVLKIPIFKGCQVLGGSRGLNNKCRHLTILETPEGIEWLKGGEFLLSAGYALKNNVDALKNVIIRAHHMKLSAIAIKEKRYLKEFPKEMIEMADEYNIPLIKLPFSLIYTEAVSSFYEALFYKKNEYLLQAKNVHERLLNLIFESKDIKSVVDVLSALTCTSIIVYDSVFNLLSWSLCKNSHEKMLKRFIDNPNILKDLADLTNKCTDIKYEDYYISFYPILSNNKTIGYMYVISDYVLNNLNRSAIRQGEMILSLKMVREESDFLREIRIKKNITDIILNSKKLPDEFYLNILDSYKWNDKNKFIGVIIKIYAANKNSMSISRFKKQIYSLVDRILGGEDFLINTGSDSIFLFFCIDNVKDINILIDKLSAFTFNYDDRIILSFGISRIYKSIKDIPQAYNECYIASLFSNEGQVIYYDTLDAVKFLYPLKDDKQVMEQFMRVIHVLEEYDSKNNGELLNTLDTYFKYNMNKHVTADKLHIHIETLRYRLNKIESLTGYSLKSSDGIFILQMNLKLRKLIKIN